MTRHEKIKWIKKHLPEFYRFLNHLIPNLIETPLNATSKEIQLYNELIVLVLKHYGYDHVMTETFQF